MCDMEHETQLRLLIEKLLETNRQFNLTAIREPQDAWTKHIVDSLWGLKTGLFDGEKSVIDIGAGAGFPGLALAIERPELQPAFLEATRKKCGFIQQMSDEFGLKAQIINDRAETAAHDPKWRAQFDVATARAVGAFSEVCEYCLPFLKPGGHAVLWRGENAPAEAKSANAVLWQLGGKIQQVLRYELEGQSRPFHLLVIQKVGSTPGRFPRAIGMPRKEPLG